MEYKKTFEVGRMNTDVDPIMLPPGEHTESKNIDFFSGVAVPMKDTIQRSLNNYTNGVTLGVLPVPVDNKIYHWYKADNYEGIDVFDINTYVSTPVLKSATGKLNFVEKITGMDKIDDFLFWCQKGNPPRRVDTSITYTTDGFDEKDISVIRPAPAYAPTIVSYTSATGENNIEEKFLSFAIRYKTISNEITAFSPFSRIAFIPKSFDFDFSTNVNNGMVNKYNSVDIKFTTGNELVKEIQLVYKEPGSDIVRLVDTFNKEELGYSDNEIQTHTFDNSKQHLILPKDQLGRLFDNVPLEAIAQTSAGSRVIYGNYTEGRDIVDENGDKIDIDYTVGYTSTAIDPATDSPKESAKSNRDLEFAIAYLDEENRLTTPLVSKNNTVFIDHEDSVNKNVIKITVPHKAPEFAKRYRFFVKQDKQDYETIVPTLFYEDGVYRWVRFQEADKDKINVGDFLVVKRDTGSVLDTDVEVKILEVTYQEKNFLRPDLTGVEATDKELRKIIQQAGYYFKIKPLGFTMDLGDLEQLEDSSYHNTRSAYDDYYRDEGKSIEAPVFYGDTVLENYGITSSGTYVPPTTGFTDTDSKGNRKDVRFTITLDSATEYSWTCNAPVTVPPSGGTTVISGSGQTDLLAYGVSVVFPAGTLGFNPGDTFVISAKNTFDDSKDFNRAVAVLEGFSDDFGPKESVEGGAQITIWVKEYGGEAKTTIVDTFFSFPQSSTRYENLEEWWYKEGASSTFSGSISSNYVFFRRGYKKKEGNSFRFYETGTTVDADGNLNPLHMIIRGQVDGKKTSDKKRGKMAASIKIVQSGSAEFALFETRPKEAIDTNIWHEIGDTYDIDENGNHLGTSNEAVLNASNVDQDWNVNPVSATSAELHLSFFNCYAFGNAVESYKIKDAFNAPYMRMDARAMSAIENYRQVVNETDLTYGEGFSKSTQVNRLNEFNNFNLNFKELSTKQEGPIKKLATRKGDLLVFQDQLISKVLFGRTILSNVDGTSNVASTTDVLGSQDFYSSKFGIGDYAESYAEFNNNFYFADPHNGTFVRGGFSGLDEIVPGRKIFFKNQFRSLSGEIPGVYDLNKDAYIASMNSKIHYYKESKNGWTTTVERDIDRMTSLNNRTFGFSGGEIYEFYEGNSIPAEIKTVINQDPHDTKTYEAVRLESNLPLTVRVESHVGDATVDDYEKREDFYYGDLPKSDGSSNRYGIGSVESVDTLDITLKKTPTGSMSIGDAVVVYVSDTPNVVGNILSKNGNVITLDADAYGVSADDFLVGEKNAVVSGDTVRGTIGELTITFDDSDNHKLSAINVAVSKSFN